MIYLSDGDERNVLSEDIVQVIKRWSEAGWEYRLICKLLRKRYNIKITKEKLSKITAQNNDN